MSSKKKYVHIIICYRATDQPERKIQLDKCLAHFKALKFNELYNGDIHVIEQGDDQPFNRGILLNAGFNIVTSGYPHNNLDGAHGHDMDNDIFVFHDVDLLPNLTLLKQYGNPPPIHLAVDGYRYVANPKKGMDKRTGGILSMSGEQFRSINGYPNDYWGWGGEDDELGRRMVATGLMRKITRPKTGKIKDLEGTSLAEKLKFLSENKQFKCPDKWERRDFHNAMRKSNKDPIGLQFINNYYKRRYSCELDIDVYKHTVMLTDKTLTNKLNYIVGDFPDITSFLERVQKEDESETTNLEPIVKCMNVSLYVAPVSSKPLTVGGRTYYKENSEIRTNKLLISEILQSIVDDCNKARIPRFAHIPKNAGTFIIFNYVVRNLGHKTHSKNVDIMICREPYDRLLSTYNYLKMDRNFWHSVDGVAIYGVNPLTKYCQTHSLSEFIEAICIDRTIIDQHTYPQYKYVDGIPKFIIRFENLQKDLKRLEDGGSIRRSINYNIKKAINKSNRDIEDLSNDDCFMLEAFYDKDFKYYDYPMKSIGDNPYIDITRIVAKIEKWIAMPHGRQHDNSKLLTNFENLNFIIKREKNGDLVARMLKRSALIAVEHDDLPTLKILITRYKVDINTTNIKDENTLYKAAKYKKHLLISKWLLDNGADITITNVYGD